jgi:hypothetical protein
VKKVALLVASHGIWLKDVNVFEQHFSCII